MTTTLPGTSLDRLDWEYCDGCDNQVIDCDCPCGRCGKTRFRCPCPKPAPRPYNPED